MAITYPLAASAFWESLRFAARPEFVLQHNRKQSMSAGGDVFSASLAAPKWTVNVGLEGGRHDRNLTSEADLKHLEGRDGQFLAYDIRRPYPDFDPGGVKLGRGSLIDVGGIAAAGDTVAGTYSVEGVPTTLSNAVTVTSDAGTYFDASGVLQTASTNVLRIDRDPVTHAVRGVLAETAFTNRLTRSREFDNSAWNKFRVTVSANAAGIFDPWGTQLADKIIENTDNNTHLIRFPYSTTNYVNHVAYVLAKAAERTRFRMQISNDTTAACRADFDLSAGTVSNVASGAGDFTGATALIRSMLNGWYWCEIQALKANNGDNDCYPTVSLMDGSGNVSYAGDGSSGLYLAHAQLEEGVAGHMPLVTTTATVSRAADALSFKAVGTNDWTVTFDDGSTQVFADDPGNFTPAASALNRPRIKAWSAVRDTNPSASSVQIKSKGSNNRSISLKGLPPLFQVRKGDKISVLYSTTKRFLCEVMEDITADVAGETLEFEVQPFLPPGLAVNDAVTLIKPLVKFKVVAGSYRPASGQGNISSGVGFSAISVP